MRRTTIGCVALVLAACGSTSEPAHERDDTTSDGSGGETTTSTPAALPGNAAVQARLAPLPAPPSPWSTVVGTLTPDDFVALCPYLASNVHLEGSSATCPDGTTAAVVEHECDPERWSAAARSLPCSITLGEMVACRLAMVDHPCDGGPYGENLDECEAFERCTCDGARPPEVRQR
jgi:hypothetical protein